MEYDVGKNFELIHEKLDLILAKLYPEETQKQGKENTPPKPQAQ